MDVFILKNFKKVTEEVEKIYVESRMISNLIIPTLDNNLLLINGERTGEN